MEIKILGQQVSTAPAFINGHNGLHGSLSTALSTGIEITLADNENLYIPKLTITNVFIGLIKKGRGQLTIGRLRILNFGGDSVNIRGSNVLIEHLIVNASTPTRPYSSLTVGSSNQQPSLQDIQAALNSDNQYVLNTSLVSWLKVIEHNTPNGVPVSYNVIPGYHVDVGMQVYDRDCSEEASLHKSESINSKDLSNITEGLRKENALVGDKTFIELFLKVLDAVTAKPHKLVTDKEMKIERIELQGNNNIISIDLPSEKGGDQTFYSLRDGAITTPEKARQELKCCEVSNIVVPRVHVTSTHRASQIFMFSEENKYTDIHIGEYELIIHSAYKHWFVANTLSNSTIGGPDSYTHIACENLPPISGSGNGAVCYNKPNIRIGNPLKKHLDCGHRTDSVTIFGMGNTQHDIPQGAVTLVN